MTGVRAGAIAAMFIVVLAIAWSVGGFHREASRTSDLSRALCETTWVAYAPTNFDPSATPVRLPDDDSIRADMTTLRRAGFDGLITYGADVPRIPEIAIAAGFRWLLLGVWNPADTAESAAVEQAARAKSVLGVIVGSESLMFRRSDMATLSAAMNRMRLATGKPVSSTEVIEAFFTNRELVAVSDFLTVNAHPYFRGISDPVKAAAWTISAYDNLAQRVGGKPILLKEVGLPSFGHTDVSEAHQAMYYATLARSHVPFAFFEGFDALFKHGPIEQSWGLFRADRSAKPAVSAVVAHRHRRCGSGQP